MSFRGISHLHNKAAICPKANILKLHKTVAVASLASDLQTPLVSKFDPFLWTGFQHFLLYAYCVTRIILIEDLLTFIKKKNSSPQD